MTEQKQVIIPSKEVAYLGRLLLESLCDNDPSLADDLRKQCELTVALLDKERDSRYKFSTDVNKQLLHVVGTHDVDAINYYTNINRFEESQICSLNIEGLRVVTEAYRQLLMQKTQQAMVDRTEKGIEVQQQLAKAAAESASKQEELVRASLESAEAQEKLAEATLKSAEEQKQLTAWTKSLVKATIVVAVATILPTIINILNSLYDGIIELWQWLL